MTTRYRISMALAGVALLALPQVASAQARYYDHSRNQWVQGETPQLRVVRNQHAKPSKQFQRQEVRIRTKETPGTIIIDTDRKFLYFVEPNGKATRYGVGVGKEGFSWGGQMKIGRKAEWPGWTPPPQMVKRERAKGNILPAYMEGGPNNPLGARALYLYRNGRDSMFRIHGTNQPWTIGLNMSSGCIRMMNEDVTHLYGRANTGSKVVVIGPGGAGREKVYAELASKRRQGNILDAIFGG